MPMSCSSLVHARESSPSSISVLARSKHRACRTCGTSAPRGARARMAARQRAVSLGPPEVHEPPPLTLAPPSEADLKDMVQRPSAASDVGVHPRSQQHVMVDQEPLQPPRERLGVASCLRVRHVLEHVDRGARPHKVC